MRRSSERAPIEPFDPHDPKYKSIADLPESVRDRFVPISRITPEGTLGEDSGFIRKEAAQHEEEALKKARVLENERYRDSRAGYPQVGEKEWKKIKKGMLMEVLHEEADEQRQFAMILEQRKALIRDQLYHESIENMKEGLREKGREGEIFVTAQLVKTVEIKRGYRQPSDYFDLYKVNLTGKIDGHDLNLTASFLVNPEKGGYIDFHKNDDEFFAVPEIPPTGEVDYRKIDAETVVKLFREYGPQAVNLYNLVIHEKESVAEEEEKLKRSLPSAYSSKEGDFIYGDKSVKERKAIADEEERKRREEEYGDEVAEFLL